MHYYPLFLNELLLDEFCLICNSFFTLSTLRILGEDWIPFGGYAETSRLMESLVRLLSYLNVMKNFSLQLKLLLETGSSRIHDCPVWQSTSAGMFLISNSLWIQWLYFSCSMCSLFHVVVQNDEVSTQIIRHLNALKGGRVTFIPLNRVQPPHVSYPLNNPDVIPLLKKLKFCSEYAPAFAQVCSSLLLLFSEISYCVQLNVWFTALVSSTFLCNLIAGFLQNINLHVDDPLNSSFWWVS